MEEHKKHDGVSPIIVAETDENVQFQQLWDYLVPPSGRAETAQGEIIRIAGRVRHEIWENGCENWDEDFRKMLRVFNQYVQLGNSFDADDIKAAEMLTNSLIKCGDEKICDGELCAVLCACAVAWVQKNPNVLVPLEADYKR